MKVERKIILTAVLATLAPILSTAFAPCVWAATPMPDMASGAINFMAMQSPDGQVMPELDFDRGFNISIVMEHVQVVIQTQTDIIHPVLPVIEPVIEEESWERTAKLETVEGIGPVYAGILQEKAGIFTVGQLLEAGATRQGRKALTEKTGIGHKLILEWVNLVDLMRIKGVHSEYSDLLEESGVDTVKELRNRVPENLYRKIKEVNKKKNLVRRLPALSQVEDWVRQARELQPVVTY